MDYLFFLLCLVEGELSEDPLPCFAGSECTPVVTRLAISSNKRAPQRNKNINGRISSTTNQVTSLDWYRYITAVPRFTRVGVKYIQVKIQSNLVTTVGSRDVDLIDLAADKLHHKDASLSLLLLL